jgi:hypothetical protein
MVVGLEHRINLEPVMIEPFRTINSFSGKDLAVGAVGVSALILFAVGLIHPAAFQPVSSATVDASPTRTVSTAPADWYKDANAAVNRNDFATALRIIRPLADQGNAKAEGFLGIMHYEGYGVPQDYAEAMKWYRRAADHGNAGAEFFIGMMYRDGKGVPKDYIQAYLWLNLASSSSEPQGPHMTLGKMASEVRDIEVASKMAPAQIADAQRLAREWKPPPPAPTPQSAESQPKPGQSADRQVAAPASVFPQSLEETLAALLGNGPDTLRRRDANTVVNNFGVEFRSLDAANCVAEIKVGLATETYYFDRIIVPEIRKYWIDHAGAGRALNYTLLGNDEDEVFCTTPTQGGKRKCWSSIHRFEAGGQERIKLIEDAMGMLYPGSCKGTTRRNPQERHQAEEREHQYEQEAEELATLNKRKIEETKPIIRPLPHDSPSTAPDQSAHVQTQSEAAPADAASCAGPLSALARPDNREALKKIAGEAIEHAKSGEVKLEDRGFSITIKSPEDAIIYQFLSLLPSKIERGSANPLWNQIRELRDQYLIALPAAVRNLDLKRLYARDPIATAPPEAANALIRDEVLVCAAPGMVEPFGQPAEE